MSMHINSFTRTAAGILSLTILASLVLSTPTARALGPKCDNSLWAHVYHGRFPGAQDRLQIIKPCIVVTGTIIVAIPEADGDFHIRVALDDQFKSLLNEKNKSAQHGYLVVEAVCERSVTQADTQKEGVCNGFAQHVYTPSMKGKHVAITGAYVTDMEHGWREIHPVTSIIVLQ
jgi:hypothetical protein